MTLNANDVIQMANEYASAWSSRTPANVAAHYAEDGQIEINRGEPIKGRAAIVDMASGFYGSFPDLVVRCDDVRVSGNHAIFVWTLEGHHVETGNLVVLPGWEEWELDDNLKVLSSKGWFDAADEARQIAGEPA